jgi:hypothetical protein
MKQTMLLSEFVKWQKKNPLETVLLDIKTAKCLVSEAKTRNGLHVDLALFVAPVDRDFDLTEPVRLTLPANFKITFTTPK